MKAKPQVTPPSAKPRRMRLKMIGSLVAVLISGWFIYASVHIVYPVQGDLQIRSDAVVSLAPQYDRLPMAQQLVDDGVANKLVISYFDHDALNGGLDANSELPTLSSFCDPEASQEIICFTPEENATIGEAYAVSKIAGEESWDSITVVTNSYHTFRTRFIFERCLGNDLAVNVVYVDRDYKVSRWVWHVVYENAAYFKAVWQVMTRC